MDLLLRLSKKGGFRNIQEVKDYFLNLYINQDNYFYDTVSRVKKLNKGDKIYFIFDSQLISEGIFTGEVLRMRIEMKNLFMGIN